MITKINWEHCFTSNFSTQCQDSILGLSLNCLPYTVFAFVVVKKKLLWFAVIFAIPYKYDIVVRLVSAPFAFYCSRYSSTFASLLYNSIFCVITISNIMLFVNQLMLATLHANKVKRSEGKGEEMWLRRNCWQESKNVTKPGLAFGQSDQCCRIGQQTQGQRQWLPASSAAFMGSS